ncbi:MAG TPA: hypothetical protein VJ842_07780 [Pyrinomonadaceae bacterium]|nr:hypothetical protein [Pyrinomonadaceae bacterium]
MLLVVASAWSPVSAQSVDLNSPTPVVSNEINGRIAPLDIGDSRSTRYFYTFNGLQGDLELTVESNNLDGDVDIFLAGNLRPLTKVTLYAGASASRASKTVYLRRAEPLILRVQARTPNDAEGTYRIRLGGAFRPAERLLGDAAASPVDETAAANTPPARSADRKVKRVSSVGARIEEPVAEVAKEEPKKEETPEAPPVATKRTPTPRTARTRTPPRRTSRAEAVRKTPPKADTGDDEAEKSEASKSDAAKGDVAKTDEGNESETEKPAAPKPERKRPVRVPRARGSRNTTTARRTDAPTTTPEAAVSVPSTPAETPSETTAPERAPSTRLVLVMRDGERFVRDMSSVRRVTVERGMLVIVSKNGTVERQPMSAVLRMSIEP